MTDNNIQLSNIDSLSLAEKILLVESLWDEIAEEAREQPISDAMKEELDIRLQAIDSGDNPSVEWEEVKKRLLASP